MGAGEGAAGAPAPPRLRYVCTACGARVPRLHKRAESSDLILLLHCDACGAVADPYCQFSAALVLVDVFLMREPAVIHLLFNRGAASLDVDSTDSGAAAAAAPIDLTFSTARLVALVALGVLAEGAAVGGVYTAACSSSSGVDNNNTNTPNALPCDHAWAAAVFRSAFQIPFMLAAAAVASFALAAGAAALPSLWSEPRTHALLAASSGLYLLPLCMCGVWDFTQADVALPYPPPAGVSFNVVHLPRALLIWACGRHAAVLNTDAVLKVMAVVAGVWAMTEASWGVVYAALLPYIEA